MKPETLSSAEISIWLIVLIVAVTWWTVAGMFRRDAARRYKRGQEQGRRFKENGISAASVASAMSAQRGEGTYGPFEAGIESVFKEGK